jgi:hypothetical protein
MKQGNVIVEKSYNFAVRVVKLSQYLTQEKKNLFWQNKYYVRELLWEQMLKKL